MCLLRKPRQSGGNLMESRTDNLTEKERNECHLAFKDGVYQVRMFPLSVPPVEVDLHGVSNQTDALKVLSLFKRLKFG